MSNKEALFTEYRNVQREIERARGSEISTQACKEALWLTIGEQIFPRIAKKFFPANAARITQREVLNNQAGNVHINITERETKAAQIGYQLPSLFTRTPDQVRHIEQLLDTIDQLIPEILVQITIMQQILQKAKSNIKKSAAIEVWDLLIGHTHLTTKEVASTLASILSTWFTSQWLDTEEINLQLVSLNTFQEKLDSLQEQLTLLAGEQRINSYESNHLSSLPNLSVVEYIDLLSDILHQGKDIGSIASLLAQWYTYLKVDDVADKLDLLANNLRSITTNSAQLRTDIAEYRQFDAAYMPPATP